jgi:hypothetical protein
MEFSSSQNLDPVSLVQSISIELKCFFPFMRMKEFNMNLNFHGRGEKMKNSFWLSLILSLSAGMIGCAKNEDSASSSTSPIPSMVAIAKGALPGALESSAVGFTIDSNLTTLKDRLFSPGPTDFMYRLKMVDERLASLGDAIKECEDATTSTYTPPAVATGFNFPMQLSCKQVVDAASLGVNDFKVYFGKSGGYWYVAELQTNTDFESSDAEPPTMGVLSKVSEAGDEMEVYQISVEKKTGVYYSTVTQIKANKTTGVFELASASSADTSQTISPGANYSGVGCGVSMNTDGVNVYATGSFEQITSCPATATVCANAVDLSDAPGSCTSLTTLSTLTLDRSAVSGNNAKSLVVDRTWVSGL